MKACQINPKVCLGIRLKVNEKGETLGNECGDDRCTVACMTPLVS